MDAADHEQVETILKLARTMTTDRRARFLDAACGGDPALRAEVEAQLQSRPEEPKPASSETGAEPTGPDAMDSIALEAVSSAGVSPESRTQAPPLPTDLAYVPEPGQEVGIDPLIGCRLGPYEIKTRIGDGGMGTVYHATRVEDFPQEVAIKLIKRGLYSELAARRFRAEIQLQAAVGNKHPHIAAILDAGETEDGRPYFVMEYVDGHRIDIYCDEHKLDIVSRLRLFRQVCEAVHFTHQNAVIHRDLKPSNILVTNDGVPKLIDFGLAKLADPDLEPDAGGRPRGAFATSWLTGHRELLFTPEFASPEQLRGETVTTASDVYSLGVILYVLLTSRMPYRFKSRATSEITLAVSEQVPERPSLAVGRVEAWSIPRAERPEPEPAPGTDSEPWRLATAPPSLDAICAARETSPKRLRRLLAGDLDAIVLMALRKEPERRYASAEQFGDDIGRFLECLPVRAQRDTWLYRADKFVRRYKAAVALGVLLMLALTAGVVGTTTGMILARRERDQAEKSFRAARAAVDEYFTRVSEEHLLNQPGFHPLRKTLLEGALRFYEDFLDQRGHDPNVRAELAEARGRVAKITRLIGSGTEAVAQFRLAVGLWNDLSSRFPGNKTYRERLAGALNDLGLALATESGGRDEALEALNRARSLIEPLIAGDPRSASLRHELALILRNRAQILREQGHPKEALELLRQVLAIETELAAEAPQKLAARTTLASTDRQVARTVNGQDGGLAPAIDSLSKAVDILDPIVREWPDHVDTAYDLAGDLADLSVLEQLAGKTDTMFAHGRRALAIFEDLDRRFPGVATYEAGLAHTCNLMGDLHRRQGEYPAALGMAQRARGILERLVANYPKDAYYPIDLSKTHNVIGRLLATAGKPDEALRSFQRAVDLLETRPELDPMNSYNLACNLALGLSLIGAKADTPAPEDESKLSPADRMRRELYGKRALAALRRSVSGGFANLEIFQTDSDLDPLRGRSDFQKFFQELVAKEKSEAKAKP